MVSGPHDKQVPTARVQELFADLGSPQKVFVDLACSSHNAMWEKNHLTLFRASLEWLTEGSVNGTKTGTLKLGSYDENTDTSRGVRGVDRSGDVPCDGAATGRGSAAGKTSDVALRQ